MEPSTVNSGIRRALCVSWSVEPWQEARRLQGVEGWRGRGRRVGAEAGRNRWNYWSEEPPRFAQTLLRETRFGVRETNGQKLF